LYAGQQPQQEPIGALLARLIEDGRAVVTAELAVFRTDFYRRLGRARTGALLCLIGAITGQAAAVALLVTLSFVLEPWIGLIGGSLVAVTVGAVLAVVLIRLGVRKLLLVVEDPEEEEEETPSGSALRSSPVDELFDRVRARSRCARDQLSDTMEEAQARLHPTALIADLIEEIADHAQMLTHRLVDAARRRPIRTGAMLIAAALLLVRPPVGRIVAGLRGATRRGATSLKNKRAESSVVSDNEENI